MMVGIQHRDEAIAPVALIYLKLGGGSLGRLHSPT
jgi:hypothetical protein